MRHLAFFLILGCLLSPAACLASQASGSVELRRTDIPETLFSLYSDSDTGIVTSGNLNGQLAPGDYTLIVVAGVHVDTTGPATQDRAEANHGARLSLSSPVLNKGGNLYSETQASLASRAIDQENLITLDPKGVQAFSEGSDSQTDRFASAIAIAGASFTGTNDRATSVLGLASAAANAASELNNCGADGISNFSWSFRVEDPGGSALASASSYSIGYAIEIIPEPSVAMLLPSGALLLGLRARRRASRAARFAS